MKGTDRVDSEHFFQLDDGGGYDLRGHSHKVNDQRSRLQLQGFFSQRVVCAWNSLPSSVVEGSFINILARRLKPDIKFNTLVAHMKYYLWHEKLSRDHFLPIYASAAQAVMTCLSADMIKHASLISMS